MPSTICGGSLVNNRSINLDEVQVLRRLTYRGIVESAYVNRQQISLSAYAPTVGRINKGFMLVQSPIFFNLFLKNHSPPSAVRFDCTSHLRSLLAVGSASPMEAPSNARSAWCKNSCFHFEI